jgi:hypothetical protein
MKNKPKAGVRMLRFEILFKNIVLGTLCLNLLGCAYGSGTDEQNKKDQEKRENLQALYSPYIGTFMGEIDAQGTKIPMTIWLYIVERSRPGLNSRGEPLPPLPTLFLRYRRTDLLEPDRILVGTVNDGTGEVLASNESGTLLNLRFKSSARNLSGEVISADGKIGNFTAQQTQAEGYAPSEGVDVDYRNRFYAAYIPYLGQYVGKGTPLEGADRSPYDISFRIEHLLYSSENSIQPKIVGFVSYKGIPFNTQTRIELVYNPPRISMVVPGVDGAFSFSGTITATEIRGVATFARAPASNVVATKHTSPPRQP